VLIEDERQWEPNRECQFSPIFLMLFMSYILSHKINQMVKITAAVTDAEKTAAEDPDPIAKPIGWLWVATTTQKK
jgi:hypothetical protein